MKQLQSSDGCKQPTVLGKRDEMGTTMKEKSDNVMHIAFIGYRKPNTYSLPGNRDLVNFGVWVFVFPVPDEDSGKKIRVFTRN